MTSTKTANSACLSKTSHNHSLSRAFDVRLVFRNLLLFIVLKLQLEKLDGFPGFSDFPVLTNDLNHIIYNQLDSTKVSKLFANSRTVDTDGLFTMAVSNSCLSP